MNNTLTLKDVFNKPSIIGRAKEFWDCKTPLERLRCGRKYKHLFHHEVDWSSCFNDLEQKQKRILVKGELIRTYDSLPNIDKTRIKNIFHLTVFSSKWYKLPNVDKNKLIRIMT